MTRKTERRTTAAVAAWTAPSPLCSHTGVLSSGGWSHLSTLHRSDCGRSRGSGVRGAGVRRGVELPQRSVPVGSLLVKSQGHDGAKEAEDEGHDSHTEGRARLNVEVIVVEATADVTVDALI